MVALIKDVLRGAASLLVLQPNERPNYIKRVNQDFSDAEAIKSDFSMVAFGITTAIKDYEQNETGKETKIARR